MYGNGALMSSLPTKSPCLSRIGGIRLWPFPGPFWLGRRISIWIGVWNNSAACDEILRDHFHFVHIFERTHTGLAPTRSH
tara:strand:+ start:1147 stop:1386 length:240 start_codon:yes stop_codon:yes gene_type:complete